MTVHTRCNFTISPEFARSWILISGSEPNLYDTPADARVIDLEDGVVPSKRNDARRAVASFLRNSTAWIRINPAETIDHAADIEAIRRSPGLSGVVLAKTESPSHIENVAMELPDIPIVALIESALGIERAFEIAMSPGTIRLAFGKGDYRRDTLTADDAGALSFARGRLVNASRAAGLPGPIDGPCLTGMPDLERALTVASAAGMTGMLCLDADDVHQIDTRLSPSADDVAWAERTIARLGAHGERVTAGCDLPLLARAKRIETLVSVFGTPRR